jgi:tetratricopeptide (TPR) repeat protein
MKQPLLFLLILIVVACQQPSSGQNEGPASTDNEELKALYEADQLDRKATVIDWPAIAERDKQRQARVYELLDSNRIRSSEDYYHAAMIFQHGMDTLASEMAIKMMQKAIELDPRRRKWLLAAAIDRDLMRKGKPQIYGTQYVRMGADDPWEMYELDSTKITDKERREFGVETLAEQREKLKAMNQKKLSELLEAGRPVDEIIALIQSAKLDNSDYDLSERAINSLGYQLMRQNRQEAALKIFKLNTSLYPNAYNTFDSYGECLVKMGKIAEGTRAYKKSLELNPRNESAIKALAVLEKN